MKFGQKNNRKPREEFAAMTDANEVKRQNTTSSQSGNTEFGSETNTQQVQKQNAKADQKKRNASSPYSK